MLRCLQALERVLGPTFGPRGSDVLVVAPGRTVLATNSGHEVAVHLAPVHPVGNLVLAAAKAHSAAHGDGSTALVLAVVAGYTKALAEASALGGLSGHLSVLRDLERVRSGDLLEQILARTLSGASLFADASSEAVPGSASEACCEGCCDRPVDAATASASGDHITREAAVGGGRSGEAGASVEDAVWAIVSAVYCGKLGPANSELLTLLTTDLVATALSAPGGAQPLSAPAGGKGRGPATVQERLRALARDPPVVATAGGALSSSCVLPGILLSESVRLWDPRTLGGPAAPAVRQRTGPVRVLLLEVNPESAQLSGMEAAREGGRGGAAPVPVALDVRTEAEYEEALQWRQRAASEAAAALKARGVGLLLCSEHVSELFAVAAAQAGVAAVQLLPLDELRRAASALGSAPCSSSLASAFLAADTGVLEGGYREVSLGTSRGLLLVSALQHTLLLRGPSIAIAQLHRRRVARALAAVASAAMPPPHLAPGGAADSVREGLWVVPGDGAVDLAVAEALGRLQPAGPGARVLAVAALAVPSWLSRNSPGDSRAHRRLLLRARQAYSGRGDGERCWVGIETVRRQADGEGGDAAGSWAPDEAGAVEAPAAVAARVCAAAEVIVQLLRFGEDSTGG